MDPKHTLLLELSGKKDRLRKLNLHCLGRKRDRREGNLKTHKEGGLERGWKARSTHSEGKDQDGNY